MFKRQSYEYYIHMLCVVSHIFLCAKFSCNYLYSFFFSGPFALNAFLELACKPFDLSALKSSHTATSLFLT